VHKGIGKYFSRGSTSGFCRWWPKSIFPGGANSDDISFCQLKTKRKTVFY